VRQGVSEDLHELALIAHSADIAKEYQNIKKILND